MTGTLREEAKLAELLALSPPGDAFPQERTGNWARYLAPIGFEHARLEVQAESMLLEADPRVAPFLLDGYERVLGDDPCLGPSSALPLAIRYQLAHQRWTNRGGASIAYFVALAAAIGVTITIEESEPFVAGVGEAGAELILETGRFEWIVHLPPTVLVEFEAGGSEAGSPLGDFVASPVECLIRSRAPAHTTVYFTYAES